MNTQQKIEKLTANVKAIGFDIGNFSYNPKKGWLYNVYDLSFKLGKTFKEADVNSSESVYYLDSFVKEAKFERKRSDNNAELMASNAVAAIHCGWNNDFILSDDPDKILNYCEKLVSISALENSYPQEIVFNYKAGKDNLLIDRNEFLAFIGKEEIQVNCGPAEQFNHVVDIHTMDWLRQNFKKYPLYEGRRKSCTYQDFTIGEIDNMNLSKL